MTNQWFQKAWWLDWGDSEITGIGNVLYAFFRAFVLFWSCTMDSFCFYCLKLRRTWNEAKFFDYIKSYVRARFNQGAFVSGHVLISWTHTSYSTCYLVDALRSNMGAYNRPLNLFNHENNYLNGHKTLEKTFKFSDAHFALFSTLVLRSMLF